MRRMSSTGRRFHANRRIILPQATPVDHGSTNTISKVDIVREVERSTPISKLARAMGISEATPSNATRKLRGEEIPWLRLIYEEARTFPARDLEERPPASLTDRKDYLASSTGLKASESAIQREANNKQENETFETRFRRLLLPLH